MSKSDTIRLTKLQKKVVKDLQNGYILITDSENKGALVALDGNNNYHINNGVFWRLVAKGMIWQNMWERHNYTLTEKGKNIKL